MGSATRGLGVQATWAATRARPAMALDRRPGRRRSALAGRRVDIALICGLLLFLLLYRLQLVAAWVSDLRVREVLYILAYLRMIFFHRWRVTPVLGLVFLYLVCCALVGVHTHLVYGPQMAINGLMRFVNVALLAPVISILVVRRQDLLLLVHLWLGIVIVGALSGLYQVLGGDLGPLTEGYVTSRGAAMRYMTLLGEPNVGGMAAPILVLLGIWVARGWAMQLTVVIAALAFLLVSVSKASFVGCALAVAISVALQFRRRSGVAGRPGWWWLVSGLRLAAVVGVIALVVVLARPDDAQKAAVHASALIVSVSGSGDPTEVSPGVIEDLGSRLIAMTVDGVRLARAESTVYALNVLIGSSFGIAGTAAEELRGEDAVITAHNGFAESYFVGGLLLLTVFVATIIAALRRLWRLARRDRLYTALFACLAVCVAFTVAYPVMSNIVVGSFFWLCIGVAGNRALANEARAHQRTAAAERS